MQDTKLDYQTWAFAIYIYVGIKGAFSMRIHRDLDETQKTARNLAMRIREAWNIDPKQPVSPVQKDETYVSGREKNKHEHKKLNVGRGTVGKAAVVGAEDRETRRAQAQVVTDTTTETLTGFADDTSYQDAKVYTDDAIACQAPTGAAHATAKHSVKEYVNGKAHVNSWESFCSLLKRGFYGSYHRMSPKHRWCYVNEFVGRHNIGELYTKDQMPVIARGLIDKHISCELLTRKTELDSTTI